MPRLERPQRCLSLLLLGLALGLGSLAPPRSTLANDTIELRIDTPRPDAVVGDVAGTTFISGKALATHGALDRYDVVFVLDRSDSSREASSIDVDGDGRITRRCEEMSRVLVFFGLLFDRCDETRDSVFHAELASVRTLLSQLDPRTTRVGLVAFGGDRDEQTPDAWSLVPVTSDHARVLSALDRLEAEGPQGLTNLESAIQIAADALEAAPMAADLAPEKVILLFSDGEPTLPRQRRVWRSHTRFSPDVHGNQRLAIRAAHTAAEASIRIDTYATKIADASDSMTLIEVARASSGVFTPVSHPRDLQTWFERGNFGEIEELRIWNQTLDEPAAYAQRDADGRFSALVPMTEGENSIGVYARAHDGAERSIEIRVQFLPDASRGDPEHWEPELQEARERLLATWLGELRRRTLRLETDRDTSQLESLRQAMRQGPLRERARHVHIEPQEDTHSAGRVRHPPCEGAVHC